MISSLKQRILESKVSKLASALFSVNIANSINSLNLLHNSLSKIVTLGLALAGVGYAGLTSAVEIPPGTKLADKQIIQTNLGSTPESLDPGINVD